MSAHPYFEEQIATFAATDPTREQCGYVLHDAAGELTATHEPNIAQDPTRFFRMDPAQFLRRIIAGGVVGYWHSHTHESAEPTDADKVVAEELQKPCWIYSAESHVLNCYVPNGYKAPLEGRLFIPLVHDCVSLVWDYFERVRGQKLPFIPRAQADYTAGFKTDLRPYMQQVGARFVHDVQPGDILLMALQIAAINHMAVYLGDGVMLHQPLRKLSERATYAGYWKKSTVAVVRVPPVTV